MKKKQSKFNNSFIKITLNCPHCRKLQNIAKFKIENKTDFKISSGKNYLFI